DRDLEVAGRTHRCREGPTEPFLAALSDAGFRQKLVVLVVQERHLPSRGKRHDVARFGEAFHPQQAISLLIGLSLANGESNRSTWNRIRSRMSLRAATRLFLIH